MDLKLASYWNSKYFQKMLGKNVEFQPFKKMTPWRKIAMGTWGHPSDPSVYGIKEFDAKQVERTVKEYKQKGIPMTPTVIAAKAIAVAMSEHPALNGVLRFGRIYYRKDVDVFLQVATDNSGQDLSGTVIRNCDQKTLEEIATELRAKSEKIRSGEDRTFKQSKFTMGLLPGWLVRPILKLLGFIMYSLNLFSPVLGAPRDAMGSVMVTSVGSLGIDHAYAPLVPYSRCPLVVAIGKIQEIPVVEDGDIRIGRKIPFCATFDHRLIDGVGVSLMIRSIEKYLENPY